MNIDSMSNQEKLKLLDNILATMTRFTFGKVQASEIVGGENELMRLIANGDVDCEKTTNSQNGKWFCNASHVLQNCRIAKQIK